MTSIAQAFCQPDQRRLLAPFVPRYFAAAVDVAARRGAAVTAAVGGDGFPFHVIDETTFGAGERCLVTDAPTGAPWEGPSATSSTTCAELSG